MRNADIRLRWMQLARWAVHFLVHANAVLPDVALISNLGCDTPLVECTGGETSLARLDPSDLSAVNFALVRPSQCLLGRRGKPLHCLLNVRLRLVLLLLMLRVDRLRDCFLLRLQ